MTGLGRKGRGGGGEFTFGLIGEEDEDSGESRDWPALVTNGGGGAVE